MKKENDSFQKRVESFSAKRKILLNEVGRALFAKIPSMTNKEREEVAEKHNLKKDNCTCCKKQQFMVDIVSETRCLVCGTVKER